jgi:hypothetical protein
VVAGCNQFIHELKGSVADPGCLFVATNLTKLLIILFFEMLKKKIWADFQRIIELFTQKFDTKLSKIWVWDPGSGKNPFRILDPESRGQKIRHRIPNPDPQHWLTVLSSEMDQAKNGLILDMS